MSHRWWTRREEVSTHVCWTSVLALQGWKRVDGLGTLEVSEAWTIRSTLVDGRP